MRRALPTLGLLSLLLWRPAAHGQGAEGEYVDHTLVKGDTCWALAQRYLGKPQRWPEIARANPHIGRCDHKKMEPGVIVRIPLSGEVPPLPAGAQGPKAGTGPTPEAEPRPRAETPTRPAPGPSDAPKAPPATEPTGRAEPTAKLPPPDARVTAMQPDVQARAPKDEGWLSARTGMDLWRGWRVNTLERASADIAFSNRTHVRLRENTLVIIYGDMVRPVRRRTTDATLDRGTLISQLDALAGKRGFSVTTPSVVATLHAGRAMVDVDAESGSTRVINHKGDPAEVRPRMKGGKKIGKPVRVVAGTGTIVIKGKRPAPPKPLPPRAQWVEAGPIRYLAAPGQGSTVGAQWASVKDATGYKVELSRAGGGRGAVALYEAPKQVDRFELQKIPPGRYAARVSVLKDGLEGPPSRAIGIEVGTLAMEISPPRNAQGQMQVAAGTALPSPPGMQCTTAGEGSPLGTPGETLQLSSPGVVRMMCTDASGRTVPGPTFAVAPVTVDLANEQRSPLERGQPRRLYLRISSDAPLPEAFSIVGPPGVEVQSLALEPTGLWGVTIIPSKEAPASFTLKVLPFDASPEARPLGLVDVTVVEPGATEGPMEGDDPTKVTSTPTESIGAVQPDLELAPTLMRAPDSIAQSPFARLGSPRALPVLDDTQRRVRIWTGSRGLPGNTEVPEALLSVGGRTHVLSRRQLRLEAGHVRVLRANLTTVTPAKVSGTWLNAGWRLGEGRPWATMLSMESWISSDDTQRLRLRPSASVSWRPARDWVLRTRQGASLGVDVAETLYASAYGVDLTLFGDIALGLQSTVTVGSLRGEGVSDIIAGPVAGLHLDWMAVMVAAQLVLSGEAEVPTVLFAVELKL